MKARGGGCRGGVGGNAMQLGVTFSSRRDARSAAGGKAEALAEAGRRKHGAAAVLSQRAIAAMDRAASLAFGTAGIFGAKT